MPKKEQTIYLITDDRDGKELPADTKPTVLVHNGKTYELYLSEKNRKELVAFLDSYVQNATPKGLALATAAKATRKKGTGELNEQRKWMRENGFPEITARGPLPKGAKEMYDAAHNK